MNKILDFIPFVMVFVASCESWASVTTLKPHRATYSISLKDAGGDSSISNIKGKMVLELNRDCKGWSLTQNAANVIELKNSPAEAMRSHYVASESHDAKKLKFFSERIFNERIADRVGGDARFHTKGGAIRYSEPETREVVMEEETIPPISHMQRLINVAQKGNEMNSVLVFDGSFYGNPVHIDTFIGHENHVCATKAKGQQAWPMSLAVYAQPSESESPSFELTQLMANNGVMCSYTINSGKYTVKGELDKLEFLPDKKCKG